MKNLKGCLIYRFSLCDKSQSVPKEIVKVLYNNTFEMSSGELC